MRMRRGILLCAVRVRMLSSHILFIIRVYSKASIINIYRENVFNVRTDGELLFWAHAIACTTCALNHDPYNNNNYTYTHSRLYMTLSNTLIIIAGKKLDKLLYKAPWADCTFHLKWSRITQNNIRSENLYIFFFIFHKHFNAISMHIICTNTWKYSTERVCVCASQCQFIY